MALSEWVDSQPEPWAMVLRFLPITGAFFLGLILVLLWKRKALPVSSVDSAEKLSLLQEELRASLGKNNSLKEQISSAGRELELKDQDLEGLRAQVAQTGEVTTATVGKTLPKVVPRGGTGIEPKEELQDFAAASEKLAKAAAQFRQKIRAEADREEAGTDDKQAAAPPAWEEFTLFRSNDPSIWNQSVDGGENHQAVSLLQMPGNASFLRLRRVDTGEGIIVPIKVCDLTGEGAGHSGGFNGSKEEFYGARHLGIYQEGLPQEVETRFAFGGWGFGHRVNGETTQAQGWAGKEISSDTVMEITVFPRLPEMLSGDRLLELP